jgi:hypothetical protein
MLIGVFVGLFVLPQLIFEAVAGATALVLSQSGPSGRSQPWDILQVEGHAGDK